MFFVGGTAMFTRGAKGFPFTSYLRRFDILAVITTKPTVVAPHKFADTPTFFHAAQSKSQRVLFRNQYTPNALSRTASLNSNVIFKKTPLLSVSDKTYIGLQTISSHHVKNKCKPGRSKLPKIYFKHQICLLTYSVQY